MEMAKKEEHAKDNKGVCKAKEKLH